MKCAKDACPICHAKVRGNIKQDLKRSRCEAFPYNLNPLPTRTEPNLVKNHISGRNL